MVGDPDVNFIGCICGRDEHVMQFRLECFAKNDVELSVSIFLDQNRNFLRRIWVAVKYIFGHKTPHGHWDCFIFKPKDAESLIRLLKQYRISRTGG